MQLFSIAIFGQFETNLKRVLSAKDFSEFLVYLNNLKTTEDDITWNWEYKRDVTESYQEGILNLEKYVTDKEDRNIRTIESYKVSIITTDRYIAYYKLEKKSGALNYNTLDELQDEVAYTKFLSSFFEIFNTELNVKDLFNTKIIYGESCGLAGIPTKEISQINEFVTNKDKASLFLWLCSANTEKQIFALDGLHQLKITGVTFNEKELKMINFVMNKKGNFLNCSGCFFSRPEIVWIRQIFEF